MQEIAVCVRGDDAGRVSPFATPIGDDCRANKG